MNLFLKNYYIFSSSLLLFFVTLLKYNLNCLGETEEGTGHFFVWLTHGYTSLSYQIDVIKLLADFVLIFFIVFIIIKFIKSKIHKYLKFTLNLISFLIILGIISMFFINEIYFEKIDCEVVYSSMSFFS